MWKGSVPEEMTFFRKNEESGEFGGSSDFGTEVESDFVIEPPPAKRKRRKSSITETAISALNLKMKEPKIQPEGESIGFNEDEFVLEMKRRGGVSK